MLLLEAEGAATLARPALSRMMMRFAVAEDVAPWMPEVASMWLLVTASVVAGASYQLADPVISRGLASCPPLYRLLRAPSKYHYLAR